MIPRVAKGHRTAALLSIHRALLGAVGPALYGGCVAFEGDVVILTWYVDPAMTEEEREDLRIAGAEVIADSPDQTRIEERFVEVSETSVPLPTAGDWIYLRRGFRTG